MMHNVLNSNTKLPTCIFEHIDKTQHEEIIYCADPSTGLKAIIAIHNTKLGPALGGTRFWHYKDEAMALHDVLRLSQSMTYKASIAGLDLGGGKAVIIGDARKIKNMHFLQSYGKVINRLHGRYITAADVNISIEDVIHIAQKTKYIVGLPLEKGGSGDPSNVTAHGVYLGMKAATQKVYGYDTLEGKKIGIEGIGKVGSCIIPYLLKEKAIIYITDTSSTRLKEISNLYPVQVVPIENFYDFDMDIYAPCALGASINDQTLARLKCKIIAGSANNQLDEEEKHSYMLLKKGIVHAPDFLINAGGLMNVYEEYIGGYTSIKAMERISTIYIRCLSVLQQAEKQQLPPNIIAKKYAEKRFNPTISNE